MVNVDLRNNTFKVKSVCIALTAPRKKKGRALQLRQYISPENLLVVTSCAGLQGIVSNNGRARIFGKSSVVFQNNMK